MKRILGCLLVVFVMMTGMSALGEGARVFVADTPAGSVLIAENGAQLTAAGEYDLIQAISHGDCPADRLLFAVSQQDLGDGMFLSDEEEGSGWDSELDDVEMWPDLEGLSEGFDMDYSGEEEWADLENPFGGDLEDSDFGLFEDDVFADSWDYGVALMNARGELLTGFDYSDLQHDVANGVVYAADADGFVTVLDEQGGVLAAGLYTSVVSDGQGGFFAIMPDMNAETLEPSETAPIVHITSDGTLNETGYYTYTSEALPGFSEGLMCIVVCDPGAGFDAGYRYMYIDASGADVFGQKYEYAFNFSAGYAEVTDADYNTWLIDRSGARVTGSGYEYFDCSDVDQPIIANLLGGGFDLISRSDLSVLASFRPNENETMMYAYYTGDGFINAFTDSRCMLIDGAGNVMYEGREDVYSNTWYKYSDAVPQRVIYMKEENGVSAFCLADFEYRQRSDWYQNLTALSWMNGQGRYAAVNFDYVQTQYEDGVFNEVDMSSWRSGVIDQDGNVIVPVEYEYLEQLAHDRYWAGNGSVYRLFDIDGNVIAEMTIE